MIVESKRYQVGIAVHSVNIAFINGVDVDTIAGVENRYFLQ
jgi:hypothetical protein